MSDTSSGTGEEKAVAVLTGLQAGTRYRFRLVVEGESRSKFGVIHEVKILPAVEGLSTAPVQNVTPGGAALTGSSTPGGVDAHYYFEWGSTTSNGNTSPLAPGTAAGKESVTAEGSLLGGHTPNTTYYYRLVGINKFEATQGKEGKSRRRARRGSQVNR